MAESGKIRRQITQFNVFIFYTALVVMTPKRFQASKVQHTKLILYM